MGASRLNPSSQAFMASGASGNIRGLVGGLFLYAALLGWADPLKVISLESVDFSLGPPHFGNVWLASDGSFLAHNQREVFHWSQDGRLRNRIGRIEGYSSFRLIVALYYEPERDVYWLVDGERQRSLFFNGEGQFLGIGYEHDDRGHPRDVYFRQLIRTPSYLFGLDWGVIDLWQSPRAKLLRRITFEFEEDRVRVRRLGLPFHELTMDQTRLSQNFKLHYIVEDQLSGNLFVAFQLSRDLRQYLPEKGDSGGWTLNPRPLSVALSGFLDPPRFFDEEIRGYDQYLNWLYSWSRVNGLYPVGEGLLMGYEIPDPGDSRSHLQVLARFEMNGQAVGSPVTYRGNLMGIHQGLVHLFYEKRRSTNFKHQVRIFKP